jgi:hypothetical protein
LNSCITRPTTSRCFGLCFLAIFGLLRRRSRNAAGGGGLPWPAGISGL